MNKEFVKFDKVDKSYDGKILVVKDLQLDIEEGEFVTMLGPSGSGKENCARTIHQESRRNNFSFIHANCSMINEDELFVNITGSLSGTTPYLFIYFSNEDANITPGKSLFLKEINLSI